MHGQAVAEKIERQLRRILPFIMQSHNTTNRRCIAYEKSSGEWAMPYRLGGDCAVEAAKHGPGMVEGRDEGGVELSPCSNPLGKRTLQIYRMNK
jgi:hypothetical protein